MRRDRGGEAARRGSRITERGYAAIVAAAGTGERARSPGGDLKQFRVVAGKPLLRWSVDVLERAGCAPVIVAVPHELRRSAASLLAGVDCLRVVAGGDTRQSSVRLALDEVETRSVVVHDAARPLVTVELVNGVVAALDRADAAIAALPVEETIKRVDHDDVVETLDRAGLYRAQTPQAFSSAVLRDAHGRAESESFLATDDAQLVERYGTKIVLVPGDPKNMKVTYPEDFAVAERLLSEG